MQIVNFNQGIEFVQYTAKVLNGPAAPGQRYRLRVFGFELSSLDDESETEVFRSFLRKLVGEWLRCGKKIMPKGTIVKGHSTGAEEWELYLASEKEIWSTTLPEDLDRRDPAINTWLWRIYWDWVHRHKPHVWFRGNGQLYMAFTSPAHSDELPPHKWPPFVRRDSPYVLTWDESLLWFVHLLNSRYAQLLDRCLHCERFFVRKRGPKRGIQYKRGGPSCGRCKVEGSKARTYAGRSAAKDRMIDVAARTWVRWKSSRSAPDRNAWIADKVNNRCLRDIEITTGKHRIGTVWVKRNMNEILTKMTNLGVQDVR